MALLFLSQGKRGQITGAASVLLEYPGPEPCASPQHKRSTVPSFHKSSECLSTLFFLYWPFTFCLCIMWRRSPKGLLRAIEGLGTWQLVFQLWVKVLPLCKVKDTQNKGCVRWELFRSHCGYSGSKRKSLFSNKVTYKRLFIDPLWMSLSSHTAPKIYFKK